MNGKLVRTSSALLALAVAVAFLFLREEEPTLCYYHNEGKVFGTYYNIRYESSSDLQDSVMVALQAFDNSLSMFNPHSVLSAVNANRDTVTDVFFEDMWSEAERVYTLSYGAFDITVAPLVNFWGFGTKDKPAPDTAHKEHAIDSLRMFVGFEKVQLVNHRVLKKDPRVMLDAGAVAKGQACDVVAAMLKRQGCTNYLVDIGGEVVAKGQNAKGDKWRVGITKPNLNNEGAQQGLQQILAVSDICMATSGNYRNYYYAGSERRSHTIDPRTGFPVQHSLLSATVVSSSCMRADALATACMVLGAEEALQMIERAGDAACYLILAQDTALAVLTSPNWDGTLQK